MTKYFFSTIAGAFFILIGGAALSQKPFTFNGLIEWNDITGASSNDDGTVFFKKETYSQDGISLPLFITQKRLDRFESVSQYRITAQDVTSVPENFLSDTQKSSLSNDWQIETKVKTGGSIAYLILEIVPFRKNNGTIERLTSFNIEVSTSAATKPANRTITFADHSVLAEGNWYKIAISKDGVYRVDANLLTSLGVDLTTLNLNQLNIYGNGGELLPESNAVDRFTDLQKNAISVVDQNNNGSFDNNDYILFYGKGPDTWKNSNIAAEPTVWRHSKHYYSDSAYYFIRTDDLTNPLRVPTQPIPDGAVNYTSTSFQDYAYIETDQFNVAKSGREFYGDAFENNTSGTYNFSVPNVLPEPAYFETSVVTRSITAASSFNFNVQGNTLTVTPSVTSTGAGADLARIASGNLTFNPTGSPINIAVNFQKANPEAQGWLDFLRINVTRALIMNGAQMNFRDTRSVGVGNVAEFQLSQVQPNISIWDITNPLQPEAVSGVNAANTYTFKSNTSTLREYIAFNNGGFLIPIAKGKVANQDLHSVANPDIVIISAPRLTTYAQELADIHIARGKSVLVTNAFDIYNEFSSGNPDPIAFRMLMKMFYNRANGVEEDQPENLVIFGDGNYLNNKGLSSQTGATVLVFESDNSVSQLNSYVSDDYFVLLDDNDTGNSANPSDKLDCGIGRIPTADISEAANYISKVRTYLASNTSADGGAFCVGDETQSTFGTWRNMLTFVCDDLDGSFGPGESQHTTTSELLANIMKAKHPQYDITKLYMDAFQQVVTPGGERYPTGEEAIRQRVELGSLLVSYVGHGGERGFAHERILTIPTISGWTNKNRLPVFLTATCELARFDDPSFKSAGELLILNPNGGAIVMLTTTRVVTGGDNRELDEAFFKFAFEKETFANLTLGKINQLTKNELESNNTSKQNFSLLGDPCLKMVYPKEYVYTTAVNGIDVTTAIDTLKALQEVTFTGYVGDENGTKLTDFNGFVYPTIYDKEASNVTLNNDGAAAGVPFKAYNNTILKGKASVVNGDFTFKFVVPYDINYTVDTARVSYYAVDGDLDAHGNSQRFKIGGSLTGAELNTVGPEIELFMNDTTFVSGGVTNTTPIFIAKLKDENGINTAGSGIGHDLVASIDGDSQNAIRLNDYYESDLDTYQSGQVRYQMNDMTPGEHRITFKAWDVHNNSTERTLDFLVADDAGIALDHVLNYPNPFTTNTAFFFEHNQPCEFLDVRIQVFTVGGKLVKTINERVKQNGFRSDSISWDGTDDFGDRIGKGVYVYRLEVKNEAGQRADKFEKLVILK